MAIAAVDTALWDLKARILGLPLVTLLGAARDEVPVYGSGGFTSYTDARLADQLGGWAAQGIPRVKMKVGRDPDRDVARVGVARDGDRSCHGALRRRQRRPLAQAGAALRGAVRRARRHLVRGARVVGRPRRAAPRPRPRARRDRRRRRRVRLHTLVLRGDARGRSGRLPPGRRHPLRGHHRVPERGGAVRGAIARAVGPLRACDPSAPVLRSAGRFATSSTSTTTCASSSAALRRDRSSR